MLRITAFLALSLSAFAAETQKPPRAAALERFIQKILAHGSPGRVVRPIAELLDVPKDNPTLDAEIFPAQTSDGLYHLLKVMVEDSPDSGAPRPKGLVLTTDHKWTGSKESYWLRVSLDGRLEKAVFVHIRRDTEGKIVKGSGTTAEKDINSPEIKQRFQHELELWLKRAYLKREWRSADFSEGVLKKKDGGL